MDFSHFLLPDPLLFNLDSSRLPGFLFHLVKLPLTLFPTWVPILSISASPPSKARVSLIQLSLLYLTQFATCGVRLQLYFSSIQWLLLQKEVWVVSGWMCLLAPRKNRKMGFSLLGSREPMGCEKKSFPQAAGVPFPRYPSQTHLTVQIDFLLKI